MATQPNAPASTTDTEPSLFKSPSTRKPRNKAAVNSESIVTAKLRRPDEINQLGHVPGPRGSPQSPFVPAPTGNDQTNGLKLAKIASFDKKYELPWGAEGG